MAARKNLSSATYRREPKKRNDVTNMKQPVIPTLKRQCQIHRYTVYVLTFLTAN
jgi:hypothetical protein